MSSDCPHSKMKYFDNLEGLVARCCYCRTEWWRRITKWDEDGTALAHVGWVQAHDHR